MTVTPCPPPTAPRARAELNDLSYLETPALRAQSLVAGFLGGLTLEDSVGDFYDAYVALGCSPTEARQLAWKDFVCESLQ